MKHSASCTLWMSIVDVASMQHDEPFTQVANKSDGGGVEAL